MTAGATIRAGARLALSRLAGRSAAIAVSVALLASIVLAVIHRRGPELLAPGRALGAVFVYVVPLVAFVVVAVVTDTTRLDAAVWCLARHGMSKRGLTMGVVLVSAVVSAAIALVCASVALALAFGSHGGFARDWLTTSWIAALAGAAHAAFFALGSAWLRRGRGRWLPLLAHFTVAGGSGVVASLLPRAHLRNLIGGSGPFDVSQPTSSLLLLLATLLVAALAIWRTGR